ncbi:Uncharacterised protein [Vibrio cholerae]|nr:Uncharacterised protein [Vibrio cholerae]
MSYSLTLFILALLHRGQREMFYWTHLTCPPLGFR